MNIIVCVKTISTSQLHNIIENPENKDFIINPFDIHALEEGIRIKEKVGGCVKIICMGVKGSQDELKKIAAMGADEIYLLSDRDFAGSDTLATSYVLSKAIEKIGECDLIICGKQSINGDTEQVGPSLAQRLQMPHITNVCNIIDVSSESLICDRIVEKGYQTVEVRLPSLISVHININKPRFPTIMNIMKTKKKNINVWGADDIQATIELCGVKGSPTKVIHIENIQYSRKFCTMIEGSTEEKAGAILKYLNDIY